MTAASRGRGAAPLTSALLGSVVRSAETADADAAVRRWRSRGLTRRGMRMAIIATSSALAVARPDSSASQKNSSGSRGSAAACWRGLARPRSRSSPRRSLDSVGDPGVSETSDVIVCFGGTASESADISTEVRGIRVNGGISRSGRAWAPARTSLSTMSGAGREWDGRLFIGHLVFHTSGPWRIHSRFRRRQAGGARGRRGGSRGRGA